MANVTCNTNETHTFNFSAVLNFPANLMSTWRQRQMLKTLDDQMLRDIGHTYKSAKREAGKPIWNVPKHWLR